MFHTFMYYVVDKVFKVKICTFQTYFRYTQENKKHSVCICRSILCFQVKSLQDLPLFLKCEN